MTEMTTKIVTPKSKKDVFDILDNQVKIYRTNSQVFQFQMWIREEQKYVRKSLHTTDRQHAIEKATEEFVKYRSRVQNDEKIFSITAFELRELFLKHIHEQVRLNQLSIGRETNIKTFTKHYLEFVGKNTRIQNIPTKQFREYLSHRRSKKSDILSSVVINESITIKQMYKFAVDENLVDRNYKPDFGVIKKPRKESVRDGYSMKEYLTLTSYSKNWYKNKDAINEEDVYYRRLLNDFIVVMSNSGFRTQECRLLKWKDIRQVRTVGEETYAEVRIREANTKVREERTIEMRRGDVFKRIKEYSNYTEQDDYVFSKFNKKEVWEKTKLYRYFNQLIKMIKSKDINFDETKTLYSLRHLFITIRIEAGKSVWDIAKITGTSINQISSHYDGVSTLTASRNMNVESIKFDKNGFVIMEERL